MHYYPLILRKNLNRIGEQTKIEPVRRKNDDLVETFSFHPKSVQEEVLGIYEHKDSLAGTLFTISSYIGYNDMNADIQPFLNQVDPGAFPGAAQAILYKLNTTQKQQFALYRKAIEYRKKINDQGINASGIYRLGDNNCGTWALKTVEKQGIAIPQGVRDLNALGVGIKGPIMSSPVNLPTIITGGAAVYGLSKLGLREMDSLMGSRYQERDLYVPTPNSVQVKDPSGLSIYVNDPWSF